MAKIGGRMLAPGLSFERSIELPHIRFRGLTGEGDTVSQFRQSRDRIGQRPPARQPVGFNLGTRRVRPRRGKAKRPAALPPLYG